MHNGFNEDLVSNRSVRHLYQRSRYEDVSFEGKTHVCTPTGVRGMSFVRSTVGQSRTC